MKTRMVKAPSSAHVMGDTWLDTEERAYNTYSGAASGSNRRALVRFPNGSLRIVRCGVADTYFTIPAKPSRGRIGTIMVDTDEHEFRFYPTA